jgi:hypothetical protein
MCEQQPQLSLSFSAVVHSRCCIQSEQSHMTRQATTLSHCLACTLEPCAPQLSIPVETSTHRAAPQLAQWSTGSVPPLIYRTVLPLSYSCDPPHRLLRSLRSLARCSAKGSLRARLCTALEEREKQAQIDRAVHEVIRSSILVARIISR